MHFVKKPVHHQPPSIEAGLQHHQSGRLADAERAYRAVLKKEPKNPDALHLLGVIAAQIGRHPEAVTLFEQAIASKPDVAGFHVNLALSFRASGNLDGAWRAAKTALTLEPMQPLALAVMGAVHLAMGNVDDAIATLLQSLGKLPNRSATHRDLGLALEKRGEIASAEKAFLNAVRLNPKDAAVLNDLGAMIANQRKLEEATEYFHRALVVDANNVEALKNLASALATRGRLQEAAEYCNRALQLRPNYAEAHVAMGNILARQLKPAGAIAAYEKAIQLRPDLAEAFLNYGIALLRLRRLDDAIMQWQRALDLKPDYPDVLNNLAATWASQGELEQSIAAYRKSLAIKPGFVEAHSSLVFTVNYDPGYTGEPAFREARQWAMQHAKGLAKTVHSVHRSHGSGRLRMAYLSPDFREHSVAFFIEPLLREHRKDSVEVFCYSDVKTPDAVTARLREYGHAWREVSDFTDEQVAAQLKSDAIDVAIDLAGHTAGNRLLSLAQRPAPLQLSMIGYPNTTGMMEIDYRVTDVLVDPPGVAELIHAENLLRLKCFWCYQPPVESPEVSPLPALRKGCATFTFGCLNTLHKITPEVIALWARILHRMPRARLILQAMGLSSTGGQNYVNRTFAANGIGSDRLELIGWTDFKEYLELLGRVDLGLDPFPFNGGTTTCHTLWMGVPVVTLAGRAAPGRMGVSLLTHAGLPDFVARDEDEYIAIAERWSESLSELRALRAGMRQRMRAFSLLDASGYTAEFESALRMVWDKQG